MEVTSFYIPNYPRANNVKFITVMIYRMYPEYTIEFREVMLHARPRPAEQSRTSTSTEPSAAKPHAEHPQSSTSTTLTTAESQKEQTQAPKGTSPEQAKERESEHRDDGHFEHMEPAT
ncbi:unnamed protein product [Strongylus vulgaris]|uniref:Uncharacterized protein n=1 Tax=Strongylus vulgaris TaxID=40348 RepID=A0A3P7IB87_STRVU|nr:unnamed protein product [Strongylus vulgaris]